MQDNIPFETKCTYQKPVCKICMICGVKAKSITHQGRFYDCANFSQVHPDKERDAICFYRYALKDEPYRMGTASNGTNE